LDLETILSDVAGPEPARADPLTDSRGVDVTRKLSETKGRSDDSDDSLLLVAEDLLEVERELEILARPSIELEQIEETRALELASGDRDQKG